MKPIRLRDFVMTGDGCLYAVSGYENDERAECVLRYVPAEDGDRTAPWGTRYKKYDFSDAFAWVKEHKPEYLDLVHRVPPSDIVRVLKPEEQAASIAARNPRAARLFSHFDLPPMTWGCTGSLLAGLENEASDIDMVVYGNAWFTARQQLMEVVARGKIPAMSEEMWQKVYRKRVPDISFDDFVLHESRKFNRGGFEGTYFDLLYSRGYDNLHAVPPITLGEKTGKMTIEATVTDASLAFDSPGIYRVDHEEIDLVLSFTHTYCGQCFTGETLEACGVVEEHRGQTWLIVGTTREAHGEYIVSRTLLDQ
ncbi:MAG: DNA polymerase subunit beta [Methanocalculaceae archaeon]|jgi:predicted nucleotidyltransferase|nr:DNA polymerase subunit beta [Methanocalculaceae archaeon]